MHIVPSPYRNHIYSRRNSRKSIVIFFLPSPFPRVFFSLSLLHWSTVRVNLRESRFRRRKLDIPAHISLRILASNALPCHHDDALFFARAFIRKFHQFCLTNTVCRSFEKLFPIISSLGWNSWIITNNALQYFSLSQSRRNYHKSFIIFEKIDRFCTEYSIYRNHSNCIINNASSSIAISIVYISLCHPFNKDQSDPRDLCNVKRVYFFRAPFHYHRNHVSRKRLTLDVPNNRGVPVAETVAAAATSS